MMSNGHAEGSNNQRPNGHPQNVSTNGTGNTHGTGGAVTNGLSATAVPNGYNEHWPLRRLPWLLRLQDLHRQFPGQMQRIANQMTHEFPLQTSTDEVEAIFHILATGSRVWDEDMEGRLWRLVDATDEIDALELHTRLRGAFGARVTWGSSETWRRITLLWAEPEEDASTGSSEQSSEEADNTNGEARH